MNMSQKKAKIFKQINKQMFDHVPFTIKETEKPKSFVMPAQDIRNHREPLKNNG